MAGINRTTGKATDLITFSRASGGTYLDSDGLLKTASTNIPRIDYAADGTVKGLLIEESRTNLVTYSEDFTDASWTKTNCSVTANSAVSPDGATNAALLSYTGSGSIATFYQDRVSSVTETSTIFIKKKDVNFVQFRPIQTAASTNNPIFDLRDGSVNAFSEASVVDAYATDAGNGYYRITIVTSGSGTERFGLTPMNDATTYTSAAADCFYIYGAQIEAGSFPTSYIPTSGATATRAADIASISVDNFGYRQDAGTVVVEFASASPLGARTNDGVFSLEVNTDDLHRVYLGATDVLNWQMRVGGSSIFATGLESGIADGQEYHIATTWKSGSQSASVDGGSAVSFGTNAALPAAATTLKIGYINVTDYLNGHIKSVTYYPRRLSNAQLQELTA